MLLALTTAGIASQAATATGRALPDLVVQPMASGLPLSTGHKHRVIVRVGNRGGARARRATLFAWLSSDAAGRIDVRRVGRHSVAAIHAGTSRMVGVGVRIPSGISTGRRYLTICADVRRHVRELSELNNCRRGVPVRITRGGVGSALGGPTGGGVDCTAHNGVLKDLPDLAHVDSNCDGIDGVASEAIFVSRLGSDANPGTMASPKLTIQAGIAAADAVVPARDVYVAAGSYTGMLALRSEVSIYGGYDPTNWSRSTLNRTTTTGEGLGVLADHATQVTLQELVVTADADRATGNAIGMRIVNGSEIVMQRVNVRTAGGRDGVSGADGTPRGVGDGLDGGSGGAGTDADGNDGAAGLGGALGGTVGAGGVHGPGATAGGSGGDGLAGAHGAGGAAAAALATSAGWVGGAGADGLNGTSGGGGGGGGAGGGTLVPASFVGGAGGSGGAGGAGGMGGSGGAAGGSSIAVIVLGSSVSMDSSSSLEAGSGGNGGAGGAGSAGGAGGAGASGHAAASPANAAAGGAGGAGGRGGSGGGGAGGSGGASAASLTDAGGRIDVAAGAVRTYGVAGAGGAGGDTGAGGAAGAAGAAGTVSYELTV